MSELVLTEWADPENKLLFATSHKRRFRFDEDPQVVWNKYPKLDVPLSKVSKRSVLVFDVMGHLRDCMDKRGDINHKRQK